MMTHKTDLALLDRIIDEVAHPLESQCELLREYLESARTCLLGDMPEECRLTLRLAMEALDCISDQARRHRVNDALSELLAERKPG